MDVIKELKILGRRINFLYPNINSGGCCVYAAIITEELHNMNIQAIGIVASHCANEKGSKTLDEVRNTISKNTVPMWEDNGIHFCHVGIEFTLDEKIYHYDSNGTRLATKKFRGDPIYRGRLQLKEMKELASSRAGWNTMFKRKDIPAIRRKIKLHFKEANAQLG